MNDILKILDILNEYSSLILVFATVIYVIFTIILAKETSKLREVETTPFISVELITFGAAYLGLKFRNIGKSPAYNVKFEINEKYEDFFGFNFKNKINYFSPGQEFECFGKQYREFLELEVTDIPIKVKYLSKDKKSFEETFYIEWESLKGRLIETKPLEKIEKHLEKIYKELEKNNSWDRKKGNYIIPRIGLVEIEKNDFYLKCIFSDGFIGKIEKNRIKDFGLNSFESIHLIDGKIYDDSKRIYIQAEEIYNKLKYQKI
jgi:hypothetical protein